MWWSWNSNPGQLALLSHSASTQEMKVPQNCLVSLTTSWREWVDQLPYKASYGIGGHASLLGRSLLPFGTGVGAIWPTALPGTQCQDPHNCLCCCFYFVLKSNIKLIEICTVQWIFTKRMYMLVSSQSRNRTWQTPQKLASAECPSVPQGWPPPKLVTS